MKREDLLKHPAYWFEQEQNELFREVTEFMSNENINKTELAKRLDVSKGYISQILNGNFNFSLKKLIELGLAIGKVPQIKYESISSVINKDKQYKIYMNFKSGGKIIPMGNNYKVPPGEYVESYNNTMTATTNPLDKLEKSA